ncbi:sigma 54-interacting transcriptional regulator [Solimonas variicoloris]|uniref:sigma 54-interacting transcriptional regulator n=1 Tax=Solimonas variicoloris TaxID=254408 RepID=UPI00036330CD|nr:sigma 54-interacting transcriptional regulator [Solimonas variicoloris]
MFGISTRKSGPATPTLERQPQPYLRIYASDFHARDAELSRNLSLLIPEGRRHELCSAAELGAQMVPPEADFVLSLLLAPSLLDGLADAVLAARAAGRSTTLIVAVTNAQLTALGEWLTRRGNENRLAGVRLMLAPNAESAVRQLPQRLIPVIEDNLIRMPISTEVENSPMRNFYVFSPELQALVARIRAYAANGIHRTYLLGGPGSGKTSLAFYYYLVRNRGRFVSVNLAAENTGDKAAVKSLLCGHVSGAFAGSGARTGAFMHARDGVCFIDESHGITGPVMEVLMEAFDNGQYLPFGASAKQPLECAIVFATNRSWETLQNSVNIDEFTRIGAATLSVPELHKREEDMIAVVATTLAKLSDRCTSWTQPKGVSEEAWLRIKQCRWHGNIRALVRVLESAFVDYGIRGGDTLIQTEEIDAGLKLWEPANHHSHQLYAVA